MISGVVMATDSKMETVREDAATAEDFSVVQNEGDRVTVKFLKESGL